jgi:hypothetical protein
LSTAPQRYPQSYPQGRRVKAGPRSSGFDSARRHRRYHVLPVVGLLLGLAAIVIGAMALGKAASKTRAAIGLGFRVVALIINVIVIAALASAGPSPVKAAATVPRRRSRRRARPPMSPHLLPVQGLLSDNGDRSDTAAQNPEQR